jgi:hypothetical protein
MRFHGRKSSLCGRYHKFNIYNNGQPYGSFRIMMNFYPSKAINSPQPFAAVFTKRALHHSTLHHSTTPSLHNSISPPLHLSTTPVLQYS